MSIKGFSVGGNVERYDYKFLDNRPSEITVDTALSDSSTNPVQNSAVTNAINAANGSISSVSGEVDDLKSAVNNAEDRLMLLDGTVYVPFEVGYVAQDASGFVYSDVNYRVRTKPGFVVTLKTGDRVGLRNYTGKRYILSRYDFTTETYKSSGWLTTGWCVEADSEGEYAIMLAYSPDQVITDINDLTDIFYIEKKPNVGTPFSVMSFNIGHFAYGQQGDGTPYKWGIDDAIYTSRLANWEKFFTKYWPDAVCLQEYSRCLDRAADGETDASGSVSTDETIFDKLYTTKITCETALGSFADNRSFTNLSVIDTASVQISDTYCTYSHINYQGKTLTLLNVHAPTTAEKRSVAFNTIVTLIQDDENVIICGDFNADISELAVFTNRGYKIANGMVYPKKATYNSTIAYYCGQDETAETSWYDFGKRVYERETRNLSIDNIIVSGNIDIVDFNICGDDFSSLTSDHCAIFANLSIH